jgi:hypothetical protein
MTEEEKPFWFHPPYMVLFDLLRLHRLKPWDVDLTWADNMYGNGNEPFKANGLLNQSSLNLEYKNRAPMVL